ncbi:hypothetical protein ACJW30_09G078200 [Castanea mollissima]
MRIPLFSRLVQILICSLTLIFAVSGQCLGDQRSYLLEFKNSLNFYGDYSTKLMRWNESVDCCSWEGVTCSEGRVVGLYLDNEPIYGGLDSSSSLFHLHYLQHLSLAYNDFNNSCIPPEFGNLTNLSYLNLSNAGFAGQIPIEISRLTRLVTLDLSLFPQFLTELNFENPDFATIVQNLTCLTKLYLDGVFISSQGNEWCQALSSSLPNLRVLSMSYCNLSGPLDSSLQKLQSLSIINLSNNNFSAPVPEFFANFRHLTSLCLRSCRLNGQIPKKIFQVPTLQTVDLSQNELLQGSLPEFHPNGSLQSLLLSDISECNSNGSIPNSMANLTQLVYLDMSSNNFTGPIPSFSHWKELQSLVSLYLHDNSLEGSIPTSLFSLPSLRTMHLGNNHFSGQLHEFSNISSFLLENLDLSSKYLEGPILMSIFKLQANLEYLDLSDNQIQGEIPNWFCKLSVLYYFLDLHSNQLQGQLPIPLPFFQFLDLSRNNFNSVIPALDLSWDDNFTAAFLSLSSNKFHGQIPESICNATSLRFLDLSNNSVNGTIPQCFSSVSNHLRVLNLRRNKLTGKIPDTFSSFCSLQTLNINKNLLEGVLPKSLANCTNLEVLDIGNNQIHDAFPCYLKGMSNLHVLVLQSNKFYGSIGCGGSNVTWPMLQIIDLSSNNFSGKLSIKALANSRAMVADSGILMRLADGLRVPVSILKNVTITLHILNLSHNSFTSQIPQSRGKLSQLESLDLSSNKLPGEIPMQLADSLTFLSVLNLSFNQLIGPIPYIKQFATFSETSYEGNKGLCGSPLKTTCTSIEPSSPPPTFEDSHSNSRPMIDWNYLSVELGFAFAFGMVIWPIVFLIFPQLYLGGKQYRGNRAHRNVGRRQ